MKILSAVLLTLLALLVFLFFLKISFRIKADGNVRMTLEILFFKIGIFPKKEKRPNPRKFTKKGLERQIMRSRKAAEKHKKKKEAKAAQKQAKADAKKAAEEAGKKKDKMSVFETVELITLLSKALLRNLSRRLHIDVKRLNIIVATGDAASTAILYGAVSGAVATLTELLANASQTKLPLPENGGVFADFVGERSSVDAEIVFSMRIWEGLFTLVSIAYNYLKHKLSKGSDK